MFLCTRRIRYLDQKVEYGEGQIHMNQTRIPFDISLESLESYDLWQAGFEYSFTSFRISLKRNKIGQLLGGFFVPTSMFAGLSLISFMINPDVVSGT